MSWWIPHGVWRSYRGLGWSMPSFDNEGPHLAQYFLEWSWFYIVPWMCGDISMRVHVWVHLWWYGYGEEEIFWKYIGHNHHCLLAHLHTCYWRFGTLVSCAMDMAWFLTPLITPRSHSWWDGIGSKISWNIEFMEWRNTLLREFNPLLYYQVHIQMLSIMPQVITNFTS